MAVLPFDQRVLANEAALYENLSTSTWGIDGSVTHYQYDANGSLILKKVAGPQPETVNYSYNLENRLTSAITTSTNAGQVVSNATLYTYNENGIRVREETRRTVNGTLSSATTNIFLVDSFNPTGSSQVLEEMPALGVRPTVSYTIGDDVISQSKPTGASGLATDYFLYDGRESTRQLANDAGQITSDYAYDAYGVMIGGSPTPDRPARTSLLYAGEQFDTNLQRYVLAPTLLRPEQWAVHQHGSLRRLGR